MWSTVLAVSFLIESLWAPSQSIRYSTHNFRAADKQELLDPWLPVRLDTAMYCLTANAGTKPLLSHSPPLPKHTFHPFLLAPERETGFPHSQACPAGHSVLGHVTGKAAGICHLPRVPLHFFGRIPHTEASIGPSASSCSSKGRHELAYVPLKH